MVVASNKNLGTAHSFRKKKNLCQNKFPTSQRIIEIRLEQREIAEKLIEHGKLNV